MENNSILGYIVEGKNKGLGLILPKPGVADAPEKGVLMSSESVTLFATAQDAQSAIERTKEYAVMKGHNWNTEENRIRPVTSQTLFSETVQCVGCKRQVKKSDSSEYYGAYVCHDCVPA
ncbi:MAG: hypothetical protein ABSB66_17070 [Candidatus Acidiferrales bacterium]|jgi:hypothetical protein